MKKRLIALLALVMMLILVIIGTALASPGGGYETSWWTVDGGGIMLSAGEEGYVLSGTAGQPEARMWKGNGYTLAGGFWGGAAAGYAVFLPLVIK